MGETVADMQEWLLDLAVGIGLQVMAELTDADVTALQDPRGQHIPDRVAVRHGTQAERRVPVRQPRV
jgi:hypothetical protein